MITVVLSRPKKFSLISWLIRKATNFPASHASLHVVGTGTLQGRTLVLEATGHGVGVIPGGWWHAKNKVVCAYTLIELQGAGSAAYCRMWDESNVPYDFMGVGRFGVLLLLRWFFGLNIRHAPDTPKRLFCSELVARWLMHLSQIAKIDNQAPVQISPEMMSPGDLVPVIKGMGCFESVSVVPGLVE